MSKDVIHSVLWSESLQDILLVPPNDFYESPQRNQMIPIFPNQCWLSIHSVLCWYSVCVGLCPRTIRSLYSTDARSVEPNKVWLGWRWLSLCVSRLALGKNWVTGFLWSSMATQRQHKNGFIKNDSYLGLRDCDRTLWKTLVSSPDLRAFHVSILVWSGCDLGGHSMFLFLCFCISLFWPGMVLNQGQLSFVVSDWESYLGSLFPFVICGKLTCVSGTLPS